MVMDLGDMKPTFAAIRQIGANFRWTRSSYILMSTFLAIILVIIIVWWPMVVSYARLYDPQRPFWVQMDWLLLGVFAVMSLLIMAGADLKADSAIVLVGFAGGMVIESWGTQTNLWNYFTLERPPLWIIPAWPIASLSIDRLFRFLDRITSVKMGSDRSKRWFRVLYWTIFPGFMVMMLSFVWPTLDKSLTLMALVLCLFLTLTPTDHRGAVLTFLAGSGLGYFLERWGTTRLCWMYYTRQTPPAFAVFAHGMAAVAFWRVVGLVRVFQPRVKALLARRAAD